MTMDIQLCERLPPFTVTSDLLKVYYLFFIYLLIFIVKMTIVLQLCEKLPLYSVTSNLLKIYYLYL